MVYGISAVGQNQLRVRYHLVLGLDSEVFRLSGFVTFGMLLSLAGPCFFSWRVGKFYLIDKAAIRIIEFRLAPNRAASTKYGYD